MILAATFVGAAIEKNLSLSPLPLAGGDGGGAANWAFETSAFAAEAALTKTRNE